MCGRYYFDDTEYELQQIKKELEAMQAEAVKTGEIFPTDTVPVILSAENKRETAAVRWGFPRWNGGGVIINARSESALDKAMFRKATLESRCIIPASGFFEWDHGDKKQTDKYYLKHPYSGVLYMAGAISTFRAEETSFSAFVIFTTSANASMLTQEADLSLFESKPRLIHDRMPVILETDELDAWLLDDAFAALVLQRQGLELAMTHAKL